MITFETQEEFENAVMEVLKKRLQLDVLSYGNFHTSVRLLDKAYTGKPALITEKRG